MAVSRWTVARGGVPGLCPLHIHPDPQNAHPNSEPWGLWTLGDNDSSHVGSWTVTDPPGRTGHKGGCVCAGQAVLAKVSVLSSQLCCELKTTLKHKDCFFFFFLKKVPKRRQSVNYKKGSISQWKTVKAESRVRQAWPEPWGKKETAAVGEHCDW